MWQQYNCKMRSLLYINDELIDLYDEAITFKFQIADIGNITSRKSSYSYTVKIPRTAKNIRIFDMLGITGNQSTKPYELVSCRYVIDGLLLVNNGYAIIQGKGDNFTLNVIDGVKSLNDTLEDLVLTDLNLSDLNHVLTLDNYIDSFSNTSGFIYGLADFGFGVDSGIVNANEQAPCIFVHTLIRKIFEDNGLTLQGDFFTSNEQYLSEVLTPYQGIDIENVTLSSVSKGVCLLDEVSYSSRVPTITSKTEQFPLTDSSLIDEVVSNDTLVIYEDGMYNFNFVTTLNLEYTSARMIIKVNGDAQVYIWLTESTTIYNATLSLNTGDVITFFIEAQSIGGYDQDEDEDGIYNEFYLLSYSASFSLSVYLKEGQLINVADYIDEDLTQLTLLKDVINRYCLMLQPIRKTKEFEFKPLEEILADRDGAEDWTGKFISLEEEYQCDYAQKNNFVNSYDKEEDSYSNDVEDEDFNIFSFEDKDGVLEINNKNLDSESDLYSSSFNIPERVGTRASQKIYSIPIWTEGDETTEDQTVEQTYSEEIINQAVDNETGDYLNLIDADNFQLGYYWNSTVGDTTQYYDSGNTYGCTNYIPVSENGLTTVDEGESSQGLASYVVFDDSYTFLRKVLDSDTYTYEEGDAYVIFVYQIDSDTNFPYTHAVVDGDTYTDYSDYLIRVYEITDTDPTASQWEASGFIRETNTALAVFYNSSDEYQFAMYDGTGSNVVKTLVNVDPNVSTDKIIILGNTSHKPRLYKIEEITVNEITNNTTSNKIMNVSKIDTNFVAALFDSEDTETISSGVPFLNVENMGLQTFADTYYASFKKLMDRYKKVTFTLNLSVIDVSNLDFFRLKFFKQTGRYYYMNNVKFKAGNFSTVEMLEISEF